MPMPSVRPNFFWSSKYFLAIQNNFGRPIFFWPAKYGFCRANYFHRPNIFDRRKYFGHRKKKFWLSKIKFGHLKILDGQKNLDGQKKIWTAKKIWTSKKILDGQKKLDMLTLTFLINEHTWLPIFQIFLPDHLYYLLHKMVNREILLVFLLFSACLSIR